MGSLSVAYYTIAPISLDLLRPGAPLGNQETRCGASGRVRSPNKGLQVLRFAN